MQIQSSEEVVTNCIMERFPDANLEVNVVNDSKVFGISHNGKLVITIDNLGAKFLFPTSYPATISVKPEVSVFIEPDSPTRSA